MTRTQYLKSIMPVYICDVCGSVADFNPKCTKCVEESIAAEYDRLTELYFDTRRDADEDGMAYVDEFGEEF